MEALNHLSQLPGDGLGITDNDIIDRLELLVGHPDPQTASPRDVARRTLRLHSNGFAGLVAGWIVVLEWAPLAVANRPHELLPELDGLLIGIRHQAPQEIPEVLRPGLKADVLGGIDIDLPQPLRGVDESAQVHIGVAMGGRPDHALRATGAGEPDVRVGLLHGQDPGVDRPVLVILPLMPEGARCGPALDNEVVGLLEPPPVLRGVNARLEGLYRGPTHKAGDDP